MLEIDKNIQEALAQSLQLYYTSLENGNLQMICTLMTEESYLITVNTLGFKRAFKDENFKKLLSEIQTNENSLKKVETTLCNDLSNESRKYHIAINSFEVNGPSRVTIHYKENSYPKKIYYATSDTRWKIDYKAGRKI
jgi:hypothetical protein